MLIFTIVNALNFIYKCEAKGKGSSVKGYL